MKIKSLISLLKRCFKQLFPFTLMLLFVTTSNVFAQNAITVTGKVTDDVGDAVIGATVEVLGGKKGTITNFKGEYSLNVDKNASIRFSFLGLSPQIVLVNGRAKIDVILKEVANEIEEVVVVGYGKQVKANMTAAVTTITAKELEDRPITSIGQILQGLSTGVTIMNQTGAPGYSPVINIRGIGTINPAENYPYCLVDGVPTYIENVDPSDIKSISILKDAAATAIYGSSGANGVILITTKSNTSKKLSIDLTAYYGMQAPTFRPELVNAIDFMKLHNIQQNSNGLAPLFSTDYIENYRRNLGTSDLYPNTDWYSELSRPAFVHNQTLSVSGGSEKFKTMLSLANFKNVGIVPNASNARKSIRLTSTFDHSKYLSMSVTFNELFTDLISPSITTLSAVEKIPTMPPIYNARLENGFYGAGSKGNNLLALAENGGLDRDTRQNTALDFGVRISPITDLDISFTYSLRQNSIYRTIFKDQYQWYNNDGTLGGTYPTTNSLQIRPTRVIANQYRGTISYRKKIKKNDFSILGGFDTSDNDQRILVASRTNFLLTQFQELDAGDVATQANTGRRDINASVSVLCRFNYVYDNKYLLEVNARQDNSSILAPGYRDAFFPSVSAGWRINQEKFMSGFKSLTNLKLRASWGRSGRAVTVEKSSFSYQSNVQLADQEVVMNETTQRGAAVTDWADESFTWEKAEMANIGLDFGLFNNKLSGEFDYFDKKTTDGVYYKDVPLTSGLTKGYTNFIALNNKGFEISLKWNDKLGKLKYNIGISFTDIINKLTDLDGVPSVVNNGGGFSKTVGKEIDAWYVYKSDGLLTPEDIADPNLPKFAKAVTGNVKILDISGPDGVPDGKIDAIYDRYYPGTKFPRYQFSVPVNLQWKDFDAYVFFQGVGKSDMLLNRYKTTQVDNNATTGTYLLYEKDMWDAETNPTGKVPVLGGNNGDQFSDYYMKSNAYIRLKTVTLGYKVPVKLTKKLAITKARIYVSGENILTFTNFYDGFDPEIPTNQQVFRYPNLKTYTVGLNLNF